MKGGRLAVFIDPYKEEQNEMAMYYGMPFFLNIFHTTQTKVLLPIFIAPASYKYLVGSNPHSMAVIAVIGLKVEPGCKADLVAIL